MRFPLTLASLGALFLLLTGLIAPVRAADPPAYDPAATSVAILPVTDATGEKLAERRKRQADTGYRNLVELFAERGFRIVSPDEVKRAIDEAKLNLEDEEDYRRENFYKVAKAVNADIVAFVLIQDTRMDVKTSLFKGNENQGRAKVKMWVLDAKQEKPILSAFVKEGKAAGASKLFNTNEGTDRRANAVGNAVKDALSDFLKPYPKVKDVKVSSEGKIE